MDGVTSRSLTFNGPLEAGVRAVAILDAAYPRAYDLQRLTALDYLVTRTSSIGGPNDLHPAAPIQTPATDVRRRVVHDALLLMMTRQLVERVADSNGIRFAAGEASTSFLESLRTDYFKRVKARARWLADNLGNRSDEEFNGLMRQLFADWVEQFQSAEQSFGASS